MVLRKTLHPAFSFCEVLLGPANPYARRHPHSQKARDGERERERQRRLHASFRVGHRAVTAITKNNMQHSQSGATKKKKPSHHSQLFKYSGKTILILSATASAANIASFFFSIRSNPRQSQRVSIAIAVSDEVCEQCLYRDLHLGGGKCMVIRSL